MNGLEEVKGEDGGRVKYVAARIIVSKDEAIDWLSAMPGGKAAMLKEWGIAKMNGMWSIQSTMNGLILVVDNPTPPEPVTEVNVVWDEWPRSMKSGSKTGEKRRVSWKVHRLVKLYLAVNIAFTALAAIFFTLFITAVKDMDVATIVHAFLSDPIGWISAWAEKVLTP